jgi:hypothetical protein
VQNGSIEFILILDSENRGSTRVCILGSITVLAAESWYEDRKTEIITFESQMPLTRIESEAFSSPSPSPQSIEIARNVDIFGSSCLFDYKSL